MEIPIGIVQVSKTASKTFVLRYSQKIYGELACDRKSITHPEFLVHYHHPQACALPHTRCLEN